MRRDRVSGRLAAPSLERAAPFQLPVCLAEGHYRIEAGDAFGRTAIREIDVEDTLARQTVTIELR